MVQRQHFSFEVWSKQAKIRFALLLKNRKRIATVAVGAYGILTLLCGLSIAQLMAPKAQASQEIPAQISAALTSDTAQIEVGKAFQLRLEIQNTATVEPLENIVIEPFSTGDQLSFSRAQMDSQLLEKKSGTFIMPSIGPQVRKIVIVDVVQTKSLGNYVGISFILTAHSQGKSIESRTNRVFLGVQGVLQSGQYIQLTVPKKTFDTKEQVIVQASVPDAETQDYQGSFWLIKDEQVQSQYDCTVSPLAPCKYTLKDLPVGNYAVYFASADNLVFSNLEQVQVTTTEPRVQLSSQAQLVLPFGTGSIAGRLPIILQDAVNKNQKPIQCILTLTKDGSEWKKDFQTYSNSNRNCEYWIDTAELNGFGAYTLTAPGTELKKNLIVTENISRLPLSIQNTVLLKDLPVTLLSDKVQSLLQTQELYDGRATLLMYNPTTFSLSRATTIGQNPITFSAGKLELELPPTFFNDASVVYASVQIDENENQKTLSRSSDWVAINFASQSIDIAQSGIEIEDINQVKLGGKPTFVVRNLVDTAGSVLNNKNCTMSFYQGSSLQPLTKTATITNGECKVSLDSGDMQYAGLATITFATNDVTTSIPLTRTILVRSGAVRSVQTISALQEPIQRNQSTQLIIGPVRDEKDNLIHNAQLQVALGQEQGRWSMTQSVNIQNGFGKILVPANLVDGNALYARVLNNDEVLMDKVFNTTDIVENTRQQETSVKTGENYKVRLENIESNALECSLTLRAKTEKTVTAPVDLASKTCIVESELIVGSPYILAQITLGPTTLTQLVTVQPGTSVNNFMMLPHTQQNSLGEAYIALISTPLLDSLGIPVNSGSLALKVNGRDVSASVHDGIASLVLGEEFGTNRDVRALRGMRILDLDMEGQLNPRSQVSNTNIRVILGNHTISSKKEAIKIKEFRSVQTIDKKQLIKIQAPACDAWLESQSGYTKLQSVYREKDCYIWVGESTVQTGYVVLFDRGNEIARLQINFVAEAPIVFWNRQSTLTAQLISPEAYEVSATLFDGDKTYQTKPHDGTLTFHQDGLVESNMYTVRVEATGGDGSTQFFYTTTLGSELR